MIELNLNQILLTPTQFDSIREEHAEVWTSIIRDYLLHGACDSKIKPSFSIVEVTLTPFENDSTLLPLILFPLNSVV